MNRRKKREDLVISISIDRNRKKYDMRKKKTARKEKCAI